MLATMKEFEAKMDAGRGKSLFKASGLDANPGAPLGTSQAEHRMSILDKQESRACLMNIGGTPFAAG
jgi:hypothetical protein